jgi:chromosome segregation ATPase
MSFYFSFVEKDEEEEIGRAENISIYLTCHASNYCPDFCFQKIKVEEMDLELEQYHKSNAALDLMIGELKLKIDGIQRETDSSDAALRASQAYLVRFRGDLKVCAQSLGQYKPLKAAVRHLFAKYVQEEGNHSSAQKDGDELELDPQMEYNREREHLEKNVEALKHKISKDMELLLADHSRLTREGVNLTEEMNLLRREAKLLRRQQKSMDLENASIGKSFASTNDTESTEAQRELEMQEGQLVALESRARELQALLR